LHRQPQDPNADDIQELAVASPFKGFEVQAKLRPSQKDHAFDLDQTLLSVVALEASVPDDATTADSLGTERFGNGVVITADGLVLTIGYLVIEAAEVTLVTNGGHRVAGHVLGSDPVTGFGLIQALEPLGLPHLTIGDSRSLEAGDAVVLAGAGGHDHALSVRFLSRQPFAGYWEYLLDEALFVGPAHPHWSGAALLGPAGDLVGLGSLAMQAETGVGASHINMCVPIELLPPILDDLSRGRPAQAPRPWLGVIAHDLQPGVIIAGLSPGGPADRAGIEEGDVILAVETKSVRSLEQFYRQLWAQGIAGTTISLRLQREGDIFDVDVRSIDRASTFKKRRLN
jgi:S1-C subfamily serine protease